ncbi:MAG: hypothetical protein ACKVOH_04700 [Chlamydiales bacterium]
MKRIPLLATIFACLTFPVLGERPDCAPSLYESREQREVFDDFDTYSLLLQKWLAGMHEVARWKWTYSQKNRDNAKEAWVWEQLSRLAEQFGSPYNWAKEVIGEQLAAGRMVVERDFAVWEKYGQEPFEDVWDLFAEIQPYLTNITNQMFVLMAKVYDHMQTHYIDHTYFPAPLSHRACDYIPDPVWRRAIAPFQHTYNNEEN